MTSRPSIAVRPLRDSDRPQWQALWDTYLDFYRTTVPPEATEGTFQRACSGTEGIFGLVAADPDDRVVGMAHAVMHASTWSVSPSCYLEDLAVAREARGAGVGRALVEAVATEASVRGAGLLYWQTQAFNAPARSLYDTVANLTSAVIYERVLRPGGSR